MKKQDAVIVTILMLAIVVATLGMSPRVVLAGASEQGCWSSGGQASGCDSFSVYEPASLALLGVGLAGIGIWRRRSRKV